MLFIAYLYLARCGNTTICQLTGHSNHTVQYYLERIKDFMKIDLDTENNKIGGEGIIVEIDESKFGKRKYNRGHQVNGVWVLGGVERTAERKTFLKIVEKRDAQTLLEAIAMNVKVGSIVYTDGWRSYNGIPLLGMQHLSVNHSRNFVDPNTGVHTNTIEGTWHGIKINLSTRHRTESMINGDLLEFIWRRNNNGNLWQAFMEMITNVRFVTENIDQENEMNNVYHNNDLAAEVNAFMNDAAMGNGSYSSYLIQI